MSSLIKQLPVYGVDLDMTPYESIVTHPYFTRTSRVQQVPFAEHLYPGCKHVREEHLLGSFYKASELAHALGLTREEAEALKVAALLHDIRHGAYSHVTDYLTAKIGISHNDKIPETVEEMFPELGTIEAVDPQRVLKILKGEDELSPMVKSVLGADKLDYVSLDLYHCGIGQFSSSRLINRTAFRGSNGSRKYGVTYDGGGGDELTDFLKAWWSAHRRIYLESSVETRRDMFRRAANYTLDDSELHTLFDMDDAALMVRLQQSDDANVRSLLDNVNNSNLHTPLFVFKLDGYTRYVDDTGAEVSSLTVDESGVMEDLSRVYDMEESLCREFDTPKGSIIISRSEDIGRMDPRKKESNVFVGGSNEPQNLEATYPDFVNYLLEEARRHFSIRLTVDPKYAQHVRQRIGNKNPKGLLF